MRPPARIVTLATAVLMASAAVAPAAHALPLEPDRSTPVATERIGPGVRLQMLPFDLSADIWEWPDDPQAWPARDTGPIRVFGREHMGKPEPAMTFEMLKIGTPVRAAYSGQVLEIRDNEAGSCDKELYISSTNPKAVVKASYDHIIPTVKPKAKVKAGDIIGTVPPWECDAPYGAMELMLIEFTPQGVQALCPMKALMPKQAPKIRAQVVALMKRWNAAPANYPSKYTEADIARGDICETTYAPG